MEAQVNKLEAMFKKTESDLNYMSRKLDTEFSAEAEEDNAQVNPKKMLQKISDIKKEYAALVKDAEAIKQAHLEATEFFKNQLMTACEALQKLQTRTDTQGPEKPEELTKVEEILGIELPQPVTPVQSAVSKTDGAEESQTTACSNSIKEKENNTATQIDEAVFETPTLSPREIREQSDEFIDITEEEFSSVSSHIRGRVKLSEVNSTYRILWMFFKEEGNTDPLTPQEMFKLGLRVTGQTGEAKLKVLKAMKLIELSRKGEVTLL